MQFLHGLLALSLKINADCCAALSCAIRLKDTTKRDPARVFSFSLYSVMSKIPSILVACAGSNKILLMTTAEHLCCVDYKALDLFGRGGFYPL